MSPLHTHADAAPARSGLRPVFSGKYRSLWVFLLLGWLISYADRTRHRPGDRVDDREQGRLHRRRGQPRHARRPGRLDVLHRLHAHPVRRAAGSATGSATARCSCVSLLWAGVLTAGLRPGRRAGRVRRRAGADRARRGRVLLQRPHDGHEPHADRPAHARAWASCSSGLSIGLTVGLLATPYLIDWGSSLGLGGEAWRMPLWVFGVVLAGRRAGHLPVLPGPRRPAAAAADRPRCGWSLYSAPTVVVIVGAVRRWPRRCGWPEWLTAIVTGVLAAGRHRAGRPQRASRPGQASTLLNRNIWLRLHRLHRGAVEPVVLQLLVGADRQGDRAEQPRRRRRSPPRSTPGAGHHRLPDRRLAGRPARARRARAASRWPSSARSSTRCWPSPSA